MGELLGWPGPSTHRQCMAHRAWLDTQWNRPTRSDYLLMRIAQRVLQAASKRPERVRLEDQNVKFEQRKPTPPVRPEQRARRSKAIWTGALKAILGPRQDGR